MDPLLTSHALKAMQSVQGGVRCSFNDAWLKKTTKTELLRHGCQMTNWRPYLAPQFQQKLIKFRQLYEPGFRGGKVHGFGYCSYFPARFAEVFRCKLQSPSWKSYVIHAHPLSIFPPPYTKGTLLPALKLNLAFDANCEVQHHPIRNNFQW